MKNILRRDLIKAAYVAGLTILFFILIFYINNLLLSIVLSSVIVYLSTPIVASLERSGLPRGLAIFTLYTATFLVLVVLGFLLFPLFLEQASFLEEELPSIQAGITNLFSQMENRIQNFLGPNSFQVSERLNQWMISQTTHYTSLLPGWVSDSLTIAFLAPFIGFFMLRDGTQFKKNFLSLIPNRFFEISLKLSYEMNDQIGNFIRARFAEAAIVGIVTWFGLFLIGFPYSFFFALFAAATNLIPYLGPVVGAVPPILLIMLNPEIVYSTPAINYLAVGIIFGLAQFLDAFVLIPIVVAKIVDLHPVTVILVIILGAQLMGILGMLISIPVASLIKLIFTTIYNHSVRIPS